MFAIPVQLLLLILSVASGYLIPQRSRLPRSAPAVYPFLSGNALSDQTSSHEENDNEQKLLLSVSEVEAQMKSLRSKYPTSEADYLAAARARNAAKTVSSERTATDEDWREIAAEKVRAVGEIDDWDNSVTEAGNSDSQILIPLTSDGDDENDEPKLMLF